ncbi:MAG: hypothetical protein HPAVJP_0370 [Candidatus Hepatoplasma vulgare]|nr:MAG: hypothetical protein HPAVJP_0370 [Candidatus Hepatoplasma sp.]
MFYNFFMRKIKIKLRDEKNLEFELLEDAKKGDYIDLNSINNIDLSNISEQIKYFKDSEYKKKIEEVLLNENQKNLLEKENIRIKLTNELNEKYLKEINELKQEIFQKSEKNKIFEKELKLETEEKKIELSKEYIDKISKLENEIKINKEKNKIFEKELKLETEEKKIELSKEYIDKISKLENEIKINKEKNEELFNEKIKNLRLEIELSKEKEISLLKIEKDELKEKNALILRDKNSNIKLLGSELEDWIENELRKAFSYNENIKIIREPNPINGQKPDFLIKIFHKNNLDSQIVIEAKTQINNEGIKKRNKDHLEKLEKYRSKIKANYGILVSELETDNDFQIYKDNSYKDIFILRPIYLISFLQFTINLLVVNEKIFNANISFEKKEKILKEWKDFKDDLYKSLDYINKQIENILIEKNKLITSSNNIEHSAKVIWDTHLSSLKNKLEKFNIDKKIIKKIEETNNNLLNEKISDYNEISLKDTN